MAGYWFNDSVAGGNGPVWDFEEMWNKPHYNEGTYISNAPGYPDAHGDFLKDPPISNGSSGSIWFFQKAGIKR